MKINHTQQTTLKVNRETLVLNKGILDDESFSSEECFVMASQEDSMVIIELLYAMYKEQSNTNTNYKEAM